MQRHLTVWVLDSEVCDVEEVSWLHIIVPRQG
jgi:hypothetical protein